MRKLYLAGSALLASTSLTFAQPSSSPPRPTFSQAQIEAITSSMGPTHSSHLAPNRADCAPDDADPVWGPGKVWLGYSCYSNVNGS